MSDFINMLNVRKENQQGSIPSSCHYGVVPISRQRTPLTRTWSKTTGFSGQLAVDSAVSAPAPGLTSTNLSY